jgi:inner membrane protein involved in colicin E2 resistance
VKYAAYLLLTFATLWLVEFWRRTRAIQYSDRRRDLRLHLLELSLSEHLGFLLSYMITTAIVDDHRLWPSRTALDASRRSSAAW